MRCEDARHGATMATVPCSAMLLCARQWPAWQCLHGYLLLPCSMPSHAAVRKAGRGLWLRSVLGSTHLRAALRRA